MDFHVLDNARDSTSLFPLYLYKPEEKKRKNPLQKMMLFEPEPDYGKNSKVVNIAPQVFEQLEKSFQGKPTPEQVLFYCYAVLFSNTYREKYAEFLKVDFPRIPFTTDPHLFLRMAELGEELTSLHLIKHKTLNNPFVKYRGEGEGYIDKPVYHENLQRVYINADKYFENVTKEMWNYHIGGYQVLEKYIKDRKKRQMSDPASYCKIAAAIAKTIEVQEKIEKLFPEAERKVISFTL